MVVIDEAHLLGNTELESLRCSRIPGWTPARTSRCYSTASTPCAGEKQGKPGGGGRLTAAIGPGSSLAGLPQDRDDPAAVGPHSERQTEVISAARADCKIRAHHLEPHRQAAAEGGDLSRCPNLSAFSRH